MKARPQSRRFWLSVTFFVCFSFLLRPAFAQGLGLNLLPQKVIVRLNNQVSINRILSDYHALLSDQVPGTPIYELTLLPGLDVLQVVQSLLADPRIVYAQPNIILTEYSGNPFTFPYEFTSKSQGYADQSSYQTVDRGKSQNWSTGAGVTVAILDTGAKLDHPALLGHFTAGYNAIQPGQLPLDLPDGKANHEVGHGTFVAGILAQVAPGASLMPVRVLNGDGNGTLMSVLKGLFYAATHGAQVINMSFGTPLYLPALIDAFHFVRGLGIVLVAAAGNEDTVEAQFPALCPDILAVASVESSGAKSPYSNYGAHIALAAPGTAIRSTYWDGGYASWSGTSFATPFVAAEAALILGLKSHPDAITTTNAILATAHSVDGVNPDYAGQLGAGLIDIYAALSRLR